MTALSDIPTAARALVYLAGQEGLDPEYVASEMLDLSVPELRKALRLATETYGLSLSPKWQGDFQAAHRMARRIKDPEAAVRYLLG